MAKVEPALPFDHFSGKLSSKERIVMRTRNGRMHAYAILNPYTGPLAESRKRAISTFSEAVHLCKTEMSDPDRLCLIPTVSLIGKTVISNTAKPRTNMLDAPMPSSSAQPPTSSIVHSVASSSPLFLPNSNLDNKFFLKHF